jgi:hypothetical protein
VPRAPAACATRHMSGRLTGAGLVYLARRLLCRRLLCGHVVGQGLGAADHVDGGLVLGPVVGISTRVGIKGGVPAQSQVAPAER